MNTDNLTDRELLEAIYENQQSDHRIIKKIHRWIKAQNIFNIFKWIIYIGLAIGLYTFVQPFFENITGTYRNLQEGAEAVGEFKASFPSFPFQ